MTPGPTPIPPEVEAAMAQPIVYHRGAEFQEVLARVLARLADVFRTSSEIVCFTASGSGAMESAVANICSPGDPVLVVSAGNFGERWVQIAKGYGLDVDHLRYPWGEAPDPGDVARRLAARGARAVYCTHSETSTGVVADVGGIAAHAREAGALTVVDAISSLGAVALEPDAWGIDVVVSGSQKALMTPPGLAFASVSPGARAAAATASSPRFYLDWERALRSQAESRTPFTPAVSLVRGLDAALELLLADGLEAAWERSRRLGRACRAGVKAAGLELFSPDDDSSAVVTAIRIPEGVDGVAIVRSMRERSGVTAAGGQGELKGKIVRIGHIGYVDLEDVAAALDALEAAFAGAGVPVERGIAADAARAAHAAARAGTAGA
ncbi:MAG: alanine--glyoxylate aminotransferase family protein [Thermoleophilia bacterium]|nr:alanine--glyoxylate aminotransferase family protein [Thermoleophilia bacterium]